MMRIRLDEAKPGMVLGADVMDAQGQILLSEGTQMSESHLRSLISRGVGLIDVETCGPSGDNGAVSSQSLAPAQAATAGEGGKPDHRAEIEAELDQRFRLTDLEHPFCRELHQEALRRALAHSEEYLQDRQDTLRGPKRRSSGNAQAVPFPKNPEDVLDGDQELSSPPSIYIRLRELIEQPGSSARDIGEIIGSDPGLTARLLRLVNSGLYSFPAPIDSVAHAVTIVGTEQLCDLALATSVVGQFRNVSHTLIDAQSFWQHSFATAVLARNLAHHRQEQNVERLFVAGLLHDVGRLILLLKCPAAEGQVLENVRTYRTECFAEERAAFSFTHADVGRALLESWGMPETLSEVAGAHHVGPARCTDKVGTSVVHIANMMAYAIGWGSSGETVVPPLAPGAWECLELVPGVLSYVLEGAEKQIVDTIHIIC